MQLKRFIVGIIVFYTMISCSFGQEKEISLIKDFLSSLFDDKISPYTIVDNYTVYNKSSTSYEAVASHIEEIRKGRYEDRGWLMPNNRIATLSNYNVISYSKYLESDVLKLNLSHIDKSNVYVLLDSNGKEVLQYFLLENGKIKSFSLFGKGKDYWFFGYD